MRPRAADSSGGCAREARVADLDHGEAGLAEGPHGGVDLVPDARVGQAVVGRVRHHDREVLGHGREG
jgi:hypothetical protein